MLTINKESNQFKELSDKSKVEKPIKKKDFYRKRNEVRIKFEDEIRNDEGNTISKNMENILGIRIHHFQQKG